MEVSEIKLDDITSDDVKVERIDNLDGMPLSNDSIDTSNPSVQGLDFLADQSKSRAHSPGPEKTSNNDSSIPNIVSNFETKASSPPIEEIKKTPEFDFSIKVEKDTNLPTFTNNSSTVTPIARRSEDNAEKQELLFKLKRLEARGIPISDNINNSSSLFDLKAEYSRLKSQRDIENSIKFQRKTMMAVASGVEFLNSKFDPFDVKLDGWSESLHENLGDYDDVFEELHEKYKSKTKIAPELKLMMMLGGSAVMYHMTQRFLSTSMPDASEIFRQNPDLAKQFANAGLASATKSNPGLGNVLGDMLNSNAPEPVSSVPQSHSAFNPPGAVGTPPSFNSVSSNKMSGPNDKDVERILNQINEIRSDNDYPGQKNAFVSPSATEPKARRGRGRPPKAPKPSQSEFSLGAL